MNKKRKKTKKRKTIRRTKSQKPISNKCYCAFPFVVKHHRVSPTGNITISRTAFIQKRFLEVITCFWVLNAGKVKDAFKPIFKREIFTDDFELLRKHSELGVDTILYGRDFKQVLFSLVMNDSDLINMDKISFV